MKPLTGSAVTSFELPTLKQIELEEYLKHGETNCILCSCVSCRKYSLILWGRYRIKCCFFCLTKHGNPGNLSQWFETNLEKPNFPRNKKGQFKEASK